MSHSAPPPSERTIVFLIGAIQCVNILDFVMVMPLGPDFARALHIPTSHLGIIGGSYTAAAAVAGLVGSLFLERFERRRALALAMLGLGLGTALGGLATGLPSLILARAVAGVFGGPATSLSMAVIADLIPQERRGKALGAVMGAFSVASVLGVPAALKLAERGGWRAPFLALALLVLIVSGAALRMLPTMRGHLQAGSAATPLSAILARPIVRWSYCMTTVVMMAGFLVIPNLSAYLQGNLGYPRDRLSHLYFFGGLVSLATTRVTGHLVDRFGSFRVVVLAAALVSAVLYLAFIHFPPPLPVLPLFLLFMLGLGMRNVSHSTLTSKVPRPGERARFMSIQSAVQHLASATGAILSSQILRERPDHGLIGMSTVVWLSIALTAVLPLLVFQVERRVRAGA